jgi:carbon storage regulator CsrA
MLTLTRKAGEAIEIEGVGTIIVTELGRGRAKLTFDVPVEYRIRRTELIEEEDE